MGINSFTSKISECHFNCFKTLNIFKIFLLTLKVQLLSSQKRENVHGDIMSQNRLDSILTKHSAYE